MVILSRINSFDLNDKQVFLRADLNVPILNGKIAQDYRLKAIKPTLDLLLNKNCRIILGTHIDRPQVYQKDLSTELLMPWFINQGYNIVFQADINLASQVIKELPVKTILLLDNLRFFEGEQGHSKEFALQLYNLAQYYVNDAFADLHRSDTSITLLPELFDYDHKSIGLLIEKELQNLNYLNNHPDKPFVLIIGGGKVKDKLPLLKVLITKVNTILVCPAIAFTFLKAMGKPVGKSLVEDSLLNQSREILDLAKANATRILFPVDYQVAINSLQGRLEYIKSSEFPDNGIGIAIGPETISIYSQEIFNAKTIFLNGFMGFFNRPETCQAFYALLQSVAQSQAYSVIGGGESVAAVYQCGLNEAIDFCSTGGGAVLDYLSGKPLPGLLYI